MLLSLCFFAVLALMPGPFFLRGNVYRQLPLYCFLEKEATGIPQSEDPETYEKIIAANAQYLGRKVQQENSAKEEKLLVKGETEHIVTDRTAGESPQEKNAEDSSSTAGKKKDKPAKGKDKDSDEPKDSAEDGKTDEEFSDSDSQPEESFSDGTKSDVDDSQPGAKTSQSDTKANDSKAAAAAIQPHPVVDLSPESLADYDYLLGQFFILDPTTATSADQLNAASFLGEDLTIKQDAQAPQILIYHSHSQETFVDSREGEPEDTVVGVGNYLTQLLSDTYGYNVIHVTETFDIIDGEIDRSRAYDFAREHIEQVLKENPSIEVIIDLHRDGVPEDRHLVTEINGKDTAQIMFYNGLSYTVSHGPVEYLPNPYIQDNLAFSFQLEYQAAQYYPDLYRGIYLAGLRYNLHLRPKALLLEAGAQTNTVQEVKNAMEPFADILNRVLQGE